METSVFAADKSAQTELALPRREVYALQLGVFDSGARAAQEMERLHREGVLCLIWQREQMRIICDAALSRETLNRACANGNGVYVFKETLPKVTMRITADEEELNEIKSFLQLADQVFIQLLNGEEAIAEILADTRSRATHALRSHPENALYTQLAENFIGWCEMIEKHKDAENISGYAAASMCMLCRELRLAVQALSAQSTASAQRTPSTAADVMPPA